MADVTKNELYAVERLILQLLDVIKRDVSKLNSRVNNQSTDLGLHTSQLTEYDINRLINKYYG